MPACTFGDCRESQSPVSLLWGLWLRLRKLRGHRHGAYPRQTVRNVQYQYHPDAGYRTLSPSLQLSLPPDLRDSCKYLWKWTEMQSSGYRFQQPSVMNSDKHLPVTLAPYSGQEHKRDKVRRGLARQIFHSISTFSLVARIMVINASTTCRLSSKLIFSQSSR